VKSTMTETCSVVLRSRRNCSSDGAERTDDGRAFHARAAVTGKAPRICEFWELFLQAVSGADATFKWAGLHQTVAQHHQLFLKLREATRGV